MVLGAGNGVGLAQRPKSSPNGEILRRGGPQGVNVKTCAQAHPACLLAAITQGQPERIIRHAWLDPDRPAYAAIAELDLNEIGIFYTKLFGRFPADYNGVVPGDLC